MTTWTMRFRGKDERDTLAKADLFYIENKQALGLDRAEFFARLVMSDEGTEAAFVATAEPLWNVRPDSGAYGQRPVGTEPAVGVGPRDAEEGWLGAEAASEGEGGWSGGEVGGAEDEGELRGSGPESAQEEDAL
ncbi:hypothetical protein [Vulgatibacter sp.]|uniref:hypothetical protein n=1 Tax=Vulgatibacter sp. TaxID=1971226 RepID=UPI00356A57B6